MRIEKGMGIILPVFQFQNDAEYYPKPRSFNPDRFAAGPKEFIDKGTFLPFGDGPRYCLGMKLALMQTKAAIYEIIKNFKLSVNSKTDKDLVIDPDSLMNVKRGGIWLNFKSLNEKCDEKPTKLIFNFEVDSSHCCD